MRYLFAVLVALFPAVVSAQTISSTLDTKSFWDSQWDVGTGIFVNGKEARLNFHRSVVLPNYIGYTGRVIDAFGLLATDKIFVYGAGFGALEETMETSFGFTSVVSADPSLWIQSAKGTTEDADLDSQCSFLGLNNLSQECRDLKDQLGDGGLRARTPILNENLLTTASRNTVRQMFSGGGPDFVLTDFIISYLTDAEAIEVSASANLVSANVLHTFSPNLSTPGQDRGVRDCAYWMALLPTDQFYDNSARRVC